MTNQDYQYIIIGAGCAGLQLAKALLSLPKNQVDSILIIESNNNHVEKSWCFWNNESHPYRHLVKHEWQNLAFRSNHHFQSSSLKNQTYQYINSAEFDLFHKNIFKEDDRINLVNDTVIDIFQHQNNCIAKCKNKNYSSTILFNSVPHLIKNTVFNPKVWQHFLGWEISTKSDSFKEDQVTLMDFDVDENVDGRFIYILPFSKKSALIECTVFSDTLLPIENYEQSLIKYLNKNYKSDYTIIKKEKGVIPMFQISNKIQFDKIIPIGTAAGCIKASTGYSFVRNIENTERIMKKLFSKNNQASKTKSRFYFYDELLLWIIANHPTQIKNIFTYLFRKNSIKNILLFLDEKTSLWQEIKILLSLPKFHFFKALFHYKPIQFFNPKHFEIPLYPEINKVSKALETKKILELEYPV